MNNELRITLLKIRIALLEGRGNNTNILRKLNRQLRALEG